MAIVTTSTHFVPAYRLPVRPISTSAGVAYAAFALSKSGGLIVDDGGTPLYYLTAHFLWHSIHLNAQSTGLRAASILSLSAYLFRFLNENDPLGQKVRNDFTGIAVLSIASQHVSTLDQEPQPRNPDRLIAVRAPAGQIAGWYFGSEVAQQTTQTQQPSFKCKTCGALNDGPDSNVCDSCGGNIY